MHIYWPLLIDRESSCGTYWDCQAVWTPCHLDLRPHAWEVRLAFIVIPPSFTECWFLSRSPHSTLTSSSGLKTRNFSTIISELTSCIKIHSAKGSRLGGVSLEFTGELNDEGYSVTECLGGSMELSEEQLGLRYQVRDSLFVCEYFWPSIQSFCDPRLNFEQSLGECVWFISQLVFNWWFRWFRCRLPYIKPFQERETWPEAGWKRRFILGARWENVEVIGGFDGTLSHPAWAKYELSWIVSTICRGLYQPAISWLILGIASQYIVRGLQMTKELRYS